jgi:Tat protein secretion system quality control protein TatD with DNase activity
VLSGPWLVSRVAEEIAKIKRLPADETAAQLGANTCRLFDLCWT